ncbi:MAG: SDR family oxidoreductase [Zymomonas mobilis]|uniref:SDR family oxidoreductase n=1 Tax=Zymomonas mobilis TaxID=542 RepID=UPI0001B707BC|nr:SDR family oxidoreductase [Zymomonas mobilis]ACV76169.1 short-chain dehydrogenase/reductase SDR [Zymomonas mobilis subsp. mobilis NCIMB 11163]AHB10857.1 short-chain alcohol dehydrogenase [Zymomonas mobilis subsp. mobilis str. CP4 = NRRL B-14023]AHJ71168.1 putative oxidoreductase [Zymomonas mobilis subsp. mobilis NRRL B-12526]AHJ73022.1 putative oxidoreductase [Zymomonas mobilis subsp. mobilis str. CP4 = NRRL B-14023]TWE24308.1 NADP-dependent 3-hydroxy acid dehydrogenase YdfG [Zymomonas mobi
MNQNIRNKIVVITGASSGLGAETARHLSDLGATVVLGARREERIATLANSIVAKGGQALAIKTDVTDRESVKNLVDTAVKTYGRIDVLLNNAGVMPLSPLEKLRVDEWELMVDVNIKGVLYGIAAALPHMKSQKFGHIINVSSVAGHKVIDGGAVYSATKFAVRALSEGLRAEVKSYNLRTTIISPGAVQSELIDGIHDEESAKQIRAIVPDMAIGADSFARCVAFAISQPENVDINEILFRPTKQAL